MSVSLQRCLCVLHTVHGIHFIIMQKGFEKYLVPADIFMAIIICLRV